MAAAVQSIPLAFETTDQLISELRWSFAIGFVGYLVIAPFCRGLTHWDLGASKRLMIFLRLFVGLELVAMAYLMYDVMSFGSPLSLHAAFSLGNNISWLYGYARPTSGLILIFCGIVGDMHPAPRLICLCGCVLEMIGDAFSARQIHDYYVEVTKKNSPTGLYSTESLFYFYWRDLISFGLCTIIIMFIVHLSFCLGLCTPQIIPYSVIMGGDLDRCEVMRDNRKIRQLCDEKYEARRGGGGGLRDKRKQCGNMSIPAISNEKTDREIAASPRSQRSMRLNEDGDKASSRAVLSSPYGSPASSNPLSGIIPPTPTRQSVHMQQLV